MHLLSTIKLNNFGQAISFDGYNWALWAAKSCFFCYDLTAGFNEPTEVRFVHPGPRQHLMFRYKLNYLTSSSPRELWELLRFHILLKLWLSSVCDIIEGSQILSMWSRAWRRITSWRDQVNPILCFHACFIQMNIGRLLCVIYRQPRFAHLKAYTIHGFLVIVLGIPYHMTLTYFNYCTIGEQASSTEIHKSANVN